MVNIVFHTEENEDSYAEFDEVNDYIEVWLGNFYDIWTLLGTIIHEVIHQEIDRAMYPYETTEKQDHYIMPRILF